jgi:hypothetical protein
VLCALRNACHRITQTRLGLLEGLLNLLCRTQKQATAGRRARHLAERELDVASAGREVHDQVVQRAPPRRRQQLLDHACAPQRMRA